MKKQALKMAEKYQMRADFVKLNFERSGRKRMATTETSKIKLYSKTSEMISQLVAEIDRLEDIRNDYAEREAKFLMPVDKKQCVCGEPLTPNTVHRKDNPCYVKEELSDEEILDLIVNKVTDADMIRQALKKASEK